VTRNHFNAAIRAFATRVPFRPFTVTLVNGRSYEVDHRGALVLTRGPGGAALYARPGGGLVIFDYEGVAEIADGLKGEAQEGGAENSSENS
jgi:hypothetical protein